MNKLLLSASLILAAQAALANPADKPDPEAQCQRYFTSTEPMMADIAEGRTPAPAESVEKVQRLLPEARALARQGHYCAAYQALLKKA